MVKPQFPSSFSYSNHIQTNIQTPLLQGFPQPQAARPPGLPREQHALAEAAPRGGVEGGLRKVGDLRAKRTLQTEDLVIS